MRLRNISYGVLFDYVPVSLRFTKRPMLVYLASSREGLMFTIRGTRVDVVVPEVRGHAIIVFE